MDDSYPKNWEEIERSESYLVCCMFDEAASLAASVLKQLLCENRSAMELIEFHDMLESAGMVFVQSLKELGRTPETLKELKRLFGSISDIPIQVFLTGVCFEMQEGPYDVREYLEEFLGMWRYVDDQYYILTGRDKNIGDMGGFDNPSVLKVDKYLEVVEVYVLLLLAVRLRDINFAISWVEKAELPEQKRQELLRQLHSLYANKATSSSVANSLKEHNMHSGSAKASEDLNTRSIGDNGAKETIMKLSKQRVPGSWWSRTFSLKLGDHRLIISSRSILVSCLAFLIYYYMRRKQANIRRILKERVLNVKKALTDLWQLAFSYQVNPLAAVQPLPPASHGSR